MIHRDRLRRAGYSRALRSSPADGGLELFCGEIE